jgi:hypothetical protein
MKPFLEFMNENQLQRLRIGDIVKLKKPINGFKYAQINGFVLDKSAKLKPIPGVGIAPTGKVAKLAVVLKASPLFKDDYGPKMDLERDLVDKINQEQEIANWK